MLQKWLTKYIFKDAPNIVMEFFVGVCGLPTKHVLSFNAWQLVIKYTMYYPPSMPVK